MPNRRPDGRPGHEPRIKRRIINLDDIVDGVIKQRDKTRDADDIQRLGAHNAEHHGGKSGGKKSLVDAVETVCLTAHIESVGECWEETGRRVSLSLGIID